jgi:hypothetical protein
LDVKTKQLFERALTRLADNGWAGSGLVDDARRLFDRVQMLLNMKLLTEDVEVAPLELACYALQLPMRLVKPAIAKKAGRPNLTDRTEQAAEMLLSVTSDRIDDPVVDRATMILHDVPKRAPVLEEAKLLADAVNLEDFGITGMLLQAVHLSRLGSGVVQVADGLEKREQYGYWDVRLKESFHFEAVRQMAKRRLEHTRRAAALLRDEMKEDRPL